MKKDLIKWVEGTYITPPQACVDSLLNKFNEAINIEWSTVDVNFEAVFYQDNLEYIALFKTTGELIEYRRSVEDGYLPFAIRQMILEKGEIMNRLLVNSGNQLFYEVIYRNTDLERFAILINDMGEVISNEKL